MPKRKGSARTTKARAARWEGGGDAGAAAAAAAAAAEGDEAGAREEPPVARLDDVESTEECFDVAGFGEVLAGTTYLTGALIGRCT